MTFTPPTLQFSIVRLLIVTTVVAFLVAALKDESFSSIARLLGGCLTAIVIPFLAVSIFRNLAFWKHRSVAASRRNDERTVIRLTTLGTFMLIAGLSTAGMYCISVTSEAIEFTTGLTPWLVPASFLAGVVWQLRRPSRSGVKIPAP